MPRLENLGGRVACCVMPGHIAVVTDSTAYLPAGMAAEHRITVVPLQVVIDGRARAEGIDVDSTELAAALRAGTPVTTSRPAPHAFAETYRRLGTEGATGIVSVHLSGDLSGTADAARAAASEVGAEGLTVWVVDSRSLGMGLGYAAIAAARAAAGGADGEQIAERATRVAMSTSTFVYVDTLEYLRRGGRIGSARALLGSALAVKPLLQLVDGRLEILERVRTASRALARLVEVAVQTTGPGPVDLAVHHLAAPEPAQEVATRLRAAVPAVGQLHVGEVGAVVGAHVGPGMIAVVVAPAR